MESERCATCGSDDPSRCRLDGVLGCDHPAIEREAVALFQGLVAGDLLRKHEAMFRQWLEDNHYA